MCAREAVGQVRRRRRALPAHCLFCRTPDRYRRVWNPSARGYALRKEGMSMSAALTVVLATLSSVITAYVAHLISLPHFHLLGGIPVGSVLIGTAAATGVAMAVRLSSHYAVAAVRMFAQLGGVTAYMGAMLLDYVAGGTGGGPARAVAAAVPGV